MKQMMLVTVAVAGLSLCGARKQLSDHGLQCSGVHRLRVKELRAYLGQHNVECNGCVEKHEFISKAMGLCDASEEVHLSEQTSLNAASFARQQSWMAIFLISYLPLLMFLLFKFMRHGKMKPFKHSENHEAIGSDATCRICLSDECEAGDELFRPCRCSGTMQHVHKSCLNSWRLNGDNPRSYYECPQCHYQYNLKRLPIADFVASPVLSKFVARFSVILCLWPFACLAKFLFGHLFYTKLVWLQSLFWGFLVFGLLVHIASSFCWIGCENTLWASFGVPLYALLQAFSDEKYIITPGTVVSVIFECAVILARVGLEVGVNLVFVNMHSATRALLRKMETAILWQVLAFDESSKREPMKASEHIDRKYDCDEDDDDEEEEQ
jgi:hypothetical protein